MFGQESQLSNVKKNKERGNDCLQIIEMKLVDIKMELAKRIGKEDKMDQMPRNWVEKRASFSVDWAYSLACQWWCHSRTMHHPLWRAWKEGRGYGDRVEEIKMERMKRLMRRQVGVKETGIGSEEARQASLSLPLSQWAQEGRANEQLMLVQTSPPYPTLSQPVNII